MSTRMTIRLHDIQAGDGAGGQGCGALGDVDWEDIQENLLRFWKTPVCT